MQKTSNFDKPFKHLREQQSINLNCFCFKNTFPFRNGRTNVSLRNFHFLSRIQLPFMITRRKARTKHQLCLSTTCFNPIQYSSITTKHSVKSIPFERNTIIPQSAFQKEEEKKRNLSITLLHFESFIHPFSSLLSPYRHLKENYSTRRITGC